MAWSAIRKVPSTTLPSLDFESWASNVTVYQDLERVRYLVEVKGHDVNGKVYYGTCKL